MVILSRAARNADRNAMEVNRHLTIPQWENLLVQYELPDIPSLIARGGFNKMS